MIDYFNSLTPHQTAAFLAAVAIAFLLYVLLCILFQKGICPLPSIMLMGFWGVSITPWLVFVSIGYKDHEALIAHERCHQEQQRRDGLLTFWFGYLFNKTKRLNYEVEAYKVWLDIQPHDYNKVMFWLEHGYNTNLTKAEISKLLTK